jgi:hypothetical protein
MANQAEHTCIPWQILSMRAKVVGEGLGQNNWRSTKEWKNGKEKVVRSRVLNVTSKTVPFQWGKILSAGVVKRAEKTTSAKQIGR